MSIDKSTLLWENLEYARLQVRILKNSNARLVKDMRINNKIFSIFIEEENPSAKGNLCKCSYYGVGSSDNVSSLHTYVEETDLSVNSCEEDVGRATEGLDVQRGRRAKEETSLRKRQKYLGLRSPRQREY